VRTLAILTPLPPQRVTERYTVAIAAAVLAILLRWLLDPVLGHVAFYVTLYVAVTFSAMVSGVAPAVLSGLLGFLGIFYWFVDPRHSLPFIRQSSEIHAIVGCFLVCAVLIALGEANRRKQLRLNESIDALITEARERKRAEDELRQAHDQLEQRVEERTAELSQALARLESEVRVRETKEAQLRHLSLRLMTLQDEERRRIARELHDSAGQTLAAMKMSIALIRQIETTPTLARLVDDLNALTDEALQEVRTTSYLLHPPLLDEVGVASAARWFVEGFARRSGIRVHCDVPENMERLSREFELVLFRVLQESLTNVHRHSGASAATVRLVLASDHLALEVGDNGKGIPEERLQRFNSSASSAGVGITGMRERVRELGGQLEIHSAKTGTTIRVALPVSIAVERSALSLST
jgi:signal transduction histidine kinase